MKLSISSPASSPSAIPPDDDNHPPLSQSAAEHPLEGLEPSLEEKAPEGLFKEILHRAMKEVSPRSGEPKDSSPTASAEEAKPARKSEEEKSHRSHDLPGPAASPMPSPFPYSAGAHPAPETKTNQRSLKAVAPHSTPSEPPTEEASLESSPSSPDSLSHNPRKPGAAISSASEKLPVSEDSTPDQHTSHKSHSSETSDASGNPAIAIPVPQFPTPSGDTAPNPVAPLAAASSTGAAGQPFDSEMMRQNNFRNLMDYLVKTVSTVSWTGTAAAPELDIQLQESVLPGTTMHIARTPSGLVVEMKSRSPEASRLIAMALPELKARLEPLGGPTEVRFEGAEEPSEEAGSEIPFRVRRNENTDSNS